MWKENETLLPYVPTNGESSTAKFAALLPAAEREVRTWEENESLNGLISYIGTNRDSTHLNADGEDEQEAGNVPISYQDSSSETVTYRTQGQHGKPRSAIVPDGIDPTTLAATLEAIHGKPVKVMDAFDQLCEAGIDAWDALGMIDAD